MISRYKPLLLSLSFLTLYALTIVFAVPPLTQYTPGETLDPSCAPGDTNCSVLISGGGFIPLTGTEVGSPVTGNIEINNTSGLKYFGSEYGDFLNFGGINDGSQGFSGFGTKVGSDYTSLYQNGIAFNFNGDFAQIEKTSDGLEINVNSSLKGLVGKEDYSPNYDDLTYVQKIWVDNNFIPLSGTVVGKPVTGIVEFEFDNGIQLRSSSPPEDYDQTIGISSASQVLTLYNNQVGVANISMDIGTLGFWMNGNTWIRGSNRYLNFGSLDSGSSGYGFRDNAGTLEWKNSAGSWAAFGGGSGWGLTGNAGTNPATNFIGTTDNQDVVIRRNNTQIARFLSSNRFFVGTNAGDGATNAGGTNFFGGSAGVNATNANSSNFLGPSAGQGATGANNSNFLGQSAGLNATGANNSNFFGASAGSGATFAANSIFLGGSAGANATNANNSNFFGSGAGENATNASNSNLFGRSAGRTFSSNNIGSNNIIIGTNISLPNATANSMNLGGVLFGTNTYATTTGDPSIVPVNTGRIGIATNTLNYTFQAGNNTVTGIVARFENSTGTCDINPTTTSLVCSSDETLKSNITTLSSSLLLLSQLRPVTYSWNTDTTNTSHVGFIAQEVESIFPSLVFTDTTTGLKSLAYTNLIPYTISALQDINLSLTTLDDTQKPNVVRDALVRFLESATNGLQKIFVRELESEKVQTQELCLDDVCVTKVQLQYLLQTMPAPVSQSLAPEAPAEEVAPLEDTPLEEGTAPVEETTPVPPVEEAAPIA